MFRFVNPANERLPATLPGGESRSGKSRQSWPEEVGRTRPTRLRPLWRAGILCFAQEFFNHTPSFPKNLAEELCHLPFSLNCSSFVQLFVPTNAPMMSFAVAAVFP